MTIGPDRSIKADPELEIEAVLGEGPLWDEVKQKLFWVDIMSGTLHEYDPETQINKTYDAGEHLGAAVLRKDGSFLLASKSGFSFFDPDTEKKERISDPESEMPGNRFNDGKCDAAGRFWAGTMAYDMEDGAGSLYCLTPNLEVKTVLTDITISNGLAWNRENDRLFYIDTPTGNIYDFRYNLQTGDISSMKVVRKFESDMGFPDGMTIDLENKLWVAFYGGGRVLRIDPDDHGRILFQIELPVPKVTSCTFGGSDLDELYITTCRENMTDRELEKAPLSGSLFRAKLPFKGTPVHRFTG